MAKNIRAFREIAKNLKAFGKIKKILEVEGISMSPLIIMGNDVSISQVQRTFQKTKYTCLHICIAF